MVEYLVEIIPAIFVVLHIIAALSVIGAFFLAFKLYLETDKEWYWLSLFLSAFFFALSQWIIILFPVPSYILGIFRELGEIVATLLLAISCYGIYRGMKEIRKMVG